MATCTGWKPVPRNRLDFRIRTGFRPQPTPIDRVTHDGLERLFGGLEAANEQLSSNRRKASLDALQAVVNFLAECDPDFQLARPLALTFAEIRAHKHESKTHILSPLGRGAGGVFGRAPEKFIKAAAAFAVESLHAHGKIGVKAAEAEVAEKLAAYSFPFGTKRKDARTVHAWRRDYRVAKPRKKKPGDNWSAADFYCGFAAQQPFTLSGDPAHDRAAIRRWFAAELRKAGYQPPDPY